MDSNQKTWHILCRNAAVSETQRVPGGGGVDLKVGGWGGVRPGTAVVNLPNSLWSFLRLCALIFRNYTWLNSVLLRDSDVFQTTILNTSDWVGSRHFILLPPPLFFVIGKRGYVQMWSCKCIPNDFHWLAMSVFYHISWCHQYLLNLSESADLYVMSFFCHMGFLWKKL